MGAETIIHTIICVVVAIWFWQINLLSIDANKLIHLIYTLS